MMLSSFRTFLHQRLEAAKVHFGFSDAVAEVLSEAPAALLLAWSGAAPDQIAFLVGLVASWKLEFFGDKQGLLYRCVPLADLPCILRTGCDVQPSDALRNGCASARPMAIACVEEGWQNVAKGRQG